MEQQPGFIREFSREGSAEERQQLARTIKEKRTKHFAEKKNEADEKSGLETGTDERERALAKQLEIIGELRGKIEGLTTSLPKELWHYFQLKKLRADVAAGERTLEELKAQQARDVAVLSELTAKMESEDAPPALLEARALLHDFYAKQKEKWAGSEYTKEDITRYFSEENLASLSPEDYILLLKRFPNEMVAHVTRQGVRDHIGLIYHTAGSGAYADGFMKMAEDGRLRSPLGVYLAEDAKEDAVAKFLHLDEFETREEALQYLRDFTNPDQQGSPGSYTDKMAVHFATEEVADCYYGSEMGNEIFIAYPSAYIASQYYFQGQLNESGGGYWNDQWVWANEERGMDLNAGLVFIPENTKVDRNTGSRYELDENKSPLANQEAMETIRRVVESPNFYEFAAEAEQILGRFNEDWMSEDLSDRNKEFRKKLEPMRLKLEQEFGITDARTRRAILDYNFLSALRVRREGMQRGTDEKYLGTIKGFTEDSLRKRGILYVEAKDTMPAKEYWDEYFTAHPGKRPSKIVYYQGNDPTKALYEWRKARGLSKTTDDRNIGFEERRISGNTAKATAGIDRFQSIAEKVINDYFDSKGNGASDQGQ